MNCADCGNWQPDDQETCDFCGAELSASDESQDEPDEQADDNLGERAMSAHTAKTMPPGLSNADTDVYRKSELAAAAEGLGQESTNPSENDSAGQLVAFGEGGHSLQPFDIPPTGLVVGRNSEHELFRNDPFLEAEHVEFLPDEHGTTVRDLSDENGIFRRIDERTRISHGTRIRLGDQLLLFERILEADDSRTEARIVGSPDPGYWCRLVLSLGGGRRAHAQAFTDSPVIIGRDDGDMTFPDNDFISGRHARIELSDGEVWIQDLDSTNGTYLEIDDDYTLRDRDRLMFGSQIVEFQAD